MRILLARHGETPWNAEGRYQGQIDIPLSPVGESQATALGKRLQEVEITRAVASPLSRARHTAELALGEARLPMLTTDIELQEIAHGEWEGLLASEINDKDPVRLRAWREQPETVLMPGGESLQQVLDRSWQGLARASEDLGAGDTLLVVAHDAVNRVILCRILG
ncbi:MAG: histidine phosphatase family protein, partial [Pseudoxanthomonas sp.]